ncbi:hypothetical protein HJFPF1_09123 [Paramyrothecium foliicola]|nr:hypothetical protein HJFPF1_09123 [Paramyrothecium foliicola]
MSSPILMMSMVHSPNRCPSVKRKPVTVERSISITRKPVGRSPPQPENAAFPSASVDSGRLSEDKKTQIQQAVPPNENDSPGSSEKGLVGQEHESATGRDCSRQEEDNDDDLATAKTPEQRALEAAVRDAVARTMTQIAQFTELLKVTHNGPHDDALERLMADTKLVSEAQISHLAPPTNWPINLSTFTRCSSTMKFDMDMYQSRAPYRWLVTERALGMTKAATQREYDAELEARLQNRRRVLGFTDPELAHNSNHENIMNWRARILHTRRLNAHFQANNAKVAPHTSGWSLHPGEYGVDLIEIPVIAIPRLPEMEPGIAGPPTPSNNWEVEGKRYPQSRRWSTIEELIRFPLGLPRVQPSEFLHSTRPEVRFIDRLGVTMNGVEQTTQCSRHSEHLIYKRSYAEWYGYDHDWACHGATYEDYRRLLAGSLAIIEANGRNFARARGELKAFFYEATENLRQRGVPIVVKFKSPLSGFQPELWQSYSISVTHLPLDQRMRRKVGYGQETTVPKPRSNVPTPIIAPPGPMFKQETDHDTSQELSSHLEALIIAYRSVPESEFDARVKAAYQVLMSSQVERRLGLIKDDTHPDPNGLVLQGLAMIQEVGLEGLAYKKLPVGMERKICVMLANLYPDTEMQEALNPCTFLLD